MPINTVKEFIMNLNEILNLMSPKNLILSNNTVIPHRFLAKWTEESINIPDLIQKIIDAGYQVDKEDKDTIRLWFSNWHSGTL